MEKLTRLIIAAFLIVAFVGNALVLWLDEQVEKIFGSDDDWNGMA